MFFENIKADERRLGLDRAIRYHILRGLRRRFIQRRPWTCVEAEVRLNGVVFEGVGFARQREYTSLLFCRRRRFPWLRVVLARRDDWCDWKGQVIALQRAIDNLVVNVTRAYRRWEEGKLWFKPKLSISELSLPEVRYEMQVIQ